MARTRYGEELRQRPWCTVSLCPSVDGDTKDPARSLWDGDNGNAMLLMTGRLDHLGTGLCTCSEGLA